MAKGSEKFGVGTVVKLLIACVVVGAIMASLDVSPKEFWTGAFDWLASGWTWMVESFEGALIYVVTGAAVVIPIWGVRTLMNRAKERREPARAEPDDQA